MSNTDELRELLCNPNHYREMDYAMLGRLRRAVVAARGIAGNIRRDGNGGYRLLPLTSDECAMLLDVLEALQPEDG